MRDENVRALQAALAAAGFYRGAVDGIFGPRTKGAIRAAQRQFGLPPTGSADARLLAALTAGASEKRASPLTDWLLRLAVGEALKHVKGLPIMNFLSGYKTYVVAAAMLLAGIAGVLGVDIPNFTGQTPGNLVMEALAFFFLRQGLKTDITKS
jgi:hypothetical protein